MKRGNHYTHRHKKKNIHCYSEILFLPFEEKLRCLGIEDNLIFFSGSLAIKKLPKDICVFFTFKNIKWLIYPPNKENYNYWPTIFMSFYFLYYNKKKHFCHWNKKIRHTFKGIFVILHRLICLFYIHEEHFDLFTLNN